MTGIIDLVYTDQSKENCIEQKKFYSGHDRSHSVQTHNIIFTCKL